MKISSGVDERRQLREPAVRADPDVERIERLHRLEPIGGEEALAERRLAEIDHRQLERRLAEATVRSARRHGAEVWGAHVRASEHTRNLDCDLRLRHPASVQPHGRSPMSQLWSMRATRMLPA